MKKQTKENKMKITDYAIAVVVILAITAIICIAYTMFAEKFKETSYASTDSIWNDTENVQINKTNNVTIPTVNIDFNSIIEENNKNVKKEEIIKKDVDLEYTTRYTESSDLPKGMLQVLQEGIVGKQEVYTKKTYEGKKLIKEESIGSKVTKSSVDKLVVIGTGPYTSNYQVKIGDTLYVTSSLLAVRIEPKDNASKIISLNKNSKVKLLQKNGKWYQIEYQSYIGWAKAECFTYIDPNSSKEETNGENNKYTKQQLLSKLSFNMSLNKPSGLSLEQFKKILKNEPKDKNKIFENNAQYFYYAEKQYGINGVFLASVAIHESAWGTSTIALNKNNLFGYGAYDSNPYNGAYQFSNCSESIDLLGRVFVKYYLNPAGTKIYDGNKALGTYYNGPTLSGINVRYATDKNWANGVYTWMKYLYNKI